MPDNWVHPQWNPRIAKGWILIGGGVAVLGGAALALELAGLAADDDDIPPLTQLLSAHENPKVVVGVSAGVAGFGIWLVHHFWLTYKDIHRRARTIDLREAPA